MDLEDSFPEGLGGAYCLMLSMVLSALSREKGDAIKRLLLKKVITYGSKLAVAGRRSTPHSCVAQTHMAASSCRMTFNASLTCGTLMQVLPILVASREPLSPDLVAWACRCPWKLPETESSGHASVTLSPPPRKASLVVGGEDDLLRRQVFLRFHVTAVLRPHIHHEVGL